jgi:multicomponent Na+:H+ antiporter subunit F
VIAVILALAALPTVYRMIVGPTILDRAVASDMLIVLVVAGMALYTASTGSSYAVAPMLGLTALAFVGTLAVARFVSRERSMPLRAAQHEHPDALQSDTLSSDAPEAEDPEAEDPETEEAPADGATPRLPGPATDAHEGEGEDR